ncbi:MAG: TlyA family RNA methyltransferase [Thermoanaerobaculales bacterium]
MARQRADVALVERKLFESRAKAQEAIAAGGVRADGRLVRKASELIDAGASIEAAPPYPWVSRGGVKLAAALAAFGVAATGKRCLDVGASTGGFTDVLLERGAAQVVALDVGRGQLDWRLRQDPRVVVIEGVNARHLAPRDLTGPFDLITVDVSFISLRLVLPALLGFLAADGDLVALVKPQFEAGRGEVGKGGVVRDAAVREHAITAVLAAAHELGLACVARISSPLAGPAGNVEELAHLRRRP